MLFKRKPTFIIAEAGINHNGNYEIAKKLIVAAKKAGADAIKFQAFKAEELIIKEAQKAKHVKCKKSFFELIKSWELSPAQYRKLAKFAKKQKIIFFASVFGEQSLKTLQKINVPLYKIASQDLINHPLLKLVAKTKKPIVISTGMGDLDEIKKAVKILEKNKKELGIMHCVSLYPPPGAEEFNLQKITMLKKLFPKHTIGYSDHSLGIFIPVSTILLGAKIIEKHFTLDKKMPGPDQKSSANSTEFAQMVKQIRYLEKAIKFGGQKLIPSKLEKDMRKAFRRSLVAARNIKKGTVITEKMLTAKRPGTGILPSKIHTVIGKKARQDIKANNLIKKNDF